MGCWKKKQSLYGTIPIRKHLTKSNQWFARITAWWYFDVSRPVTVQVNTSQKGLGASQLQDGHPVAFSSKALTPVKQHYANIECGLLTCVFGAE